MLAELFPFTPRDLPPWAVAGIVIGAVVGLPLFIGGIGMYVWEGVRGKGRDEGGQEAASGGEREG